MTHSSDVLCVLGPDGTLRFASPSAERILGYRPDDMVGRYVFDLVHSEDLEAARQSSAGSIARRPEVVEIRSARATGSG
jgi:PAS domain S-box-containing protein